MRRNGIDEAEANLNDNFRATFSKTVKRHCQFAAFSAPPKASTSVYRKQAPPAQIALSWLLVQKSWIAPTPGTTKLHRLKENLGAASVGLIPDELSEIDDAAAKITVVEVEGWKV